VTRAWTSMPGPRAAILLFEDPTELVMDMIAFCD